METNGQPAPAESSSATTTSLPSRPRRFNLPSLLFVLAGLTLGGAALIIYSLSDPGANPKPKEPKGTAWAWDEVFPDWPKNQKPDFAIVLSGQTYGYLQKCGCSNPQKGGLERRFNLIDGLKAEGVETIPLDLGDVAPQIAENSKLLHSQALLKYQTAMRAMKTMGYRNVGLGKEEFALGLEKVLGEFSLQQGNEQPGMLAANLVGSKNGGKVLPKRIAFPNAANDDTAIRDWNIIATKGKFNIGVIGMVGESIVKDAKGFDQSLEFAPEFDKVVDKALKEMNAQPSKPNLNVLLFAGPIQAARFEVKAFPQIQIVVCRTEETEPPLRETMLTNKDIPNLNTMLIQVGHRGQNIGVVGFFKNKQGGFDLKYQLVTMTPAFETPKGKEAENAVLKELDRYSKKVKDDGFLTKNRKALHPLQAKNEKAAYVGSLICAACHADADAVHGKSKHAAAYAALEGATKPAGRQFDGECIRCHTVGYDFKTGFVDAVKTPLLKNVGCENCHGPGSQHSALPKDKKLQAEMSPWIVRPGDKMPSVEQIAAFGKTEDPAKRQKIMNAVEYAVMLRVDGICQKCHNDENDPHFRFEEFWPKIAHPTKKKGDGK